jgi:hypothetical protein
VGTEFGCYVRDQRGSTERFDDWRKVIVVGKGDEKTFCGCDESWEGEDLVLVVMGEGVPHVVCLPVEASSCVLSTSREYVRFQKTVQ